MAKKRLSEVIRAECCADVNAAAASYEAFKDLGTLTASYPKVAEAINDEAELRPTIGGPKGVLEKLARPFLDAEVARLQGDGDPAEGGDVDQVVAGLQSRVSQLETRVSQLEKATAPSA